MISRRAGVVFNDAASLEYGLTFQVFSKDHCQICLKAQAVLRRFGFEPAVRYVDGPEATPENLADFAWLDWTDTPPLVVAIEGDKVLARWTGEAIRGSWVPVLRRWLANHPPEQPRS